MRVRTRVAAVGLLAAGVLAGGAVLVAPRDDGPAPPVAAATVGPVGGAASAEGLRAGIEAARKRLERLPGDWLTWAELGMALVQQARVTGDPANYARAEDALATSLKVRPAGNAAALTGRGALAAARHDFPGALDLGRRAVTAEPYSAAAHGVVADALIELGRYDEAAASIQRMIDLRPDTGSYARASYLYELRGKTHAATDAMRLALEAAGSPSDTAFVYQHLAQLAFDAGDLAGTAALVDDGLRAAPQWMPLRALRAQVAAARGDLPGAVAQMRPVAASMPVPQYSMALGDLLAASGDRAGAQVQYGLVRAATKLLAGAGVAVDLDQVGFEADRSILDGTPLPPALLAEARAGRAVRQTVVASDALAWALHAAGRDAEALRYADAALALGTRNAAFLYHRGMIRLATGDRTGARGDLSAALRMNPYFSVRHVPVARKALGSL